MSADLYKLYVDDLRHILESSAVGGKIDNIELNASACSDYVLLMSNSTYELQTLIYFSLQYIKLHRYILQPVLWDIKVVLPSLVNFGPFLTNFVHQIREKTEKNYD